MPEEYGGQVSDWSTAKYPGILGATPTTPIALDAQIAALINGGSLSGGDKLARMSDLTSAIPGAAVAAVRSSGVLDEIDFKVITAISPFVLAPASRVWTKGNICYVSVILQINPQTTFTNTDGVGVNCVSGLPPCPANAPGSNREDNGLLIAVSRWRRATINAVPFVASVAEVSAAGNLHLATDYPLIGNPVAGYVDFVTISGHYPITLVDAVP